MDGECYWHSKVAAMSNGGLPMAELGRPLDQMLTMMDRRDEREYIRYQRGVRYMYEGQALSV